MKITLDIPDGTVCAFINYIYYDFCGMKMGVKSLDTGDLKDGSEVRVEPEREDGEA